MITDNFIFFFIFSILVNTRVCCTLGYYNILVRNCIGFTSGIIFVEIWNLSWSVWRRLGWTFYTRYYSLLSFLSVIPIFTVINTINFTSSICTSCYVVKTTLITSFFAFYTISLIIRSVCDYSIYWTIL